MGRTITARISTSQAYIRTQSHHHGAHEAGAERATVCCRCTPVRRFPLSVCIVLMLAVGIAGMLLR